MMKMMMKVDIYDMRMESSLNKEIFALGLADGSEITDYNKWKYREDYL